MLCRSSPECEERSLRHDIMKDVWTLAVELKLLRRFVWR